jgi:hypothetical protein
METFDGAWVARHVAQTVDIWNACAWNKSTAAAAIEAPQYPADERLKREQAYDEALEAVENDLEVPAKNATERREGQNRIVRSFSRFSARALGLDGDAIDLLTNEFMPVGTTLARCARQFDPSLPMNDIIQAARNAWTACGLQPLLGAPVTLTSSIFGYSLLYPYSDNLLDNESISAAAKLKFSRRFRSRLRGEALQAEDDRERAVWALVAMIEAEYPRKDFPQAFDCLLAIHRAQENSLNQLHANGSAPPSESLRLSCAKGGTSVLADACLVHGSLDEAESRFAFEWGVLLQLGDDVQDVKDDLRRGSITLFSRAAAADQPLDALTIQLLNFSERVGNRLDKLPHGAPALKNLLKMSWRSLIIRAVADSHQFFSARFLSEAEKCSPFRFDFLRKRSARLAGREGLYTALFESLLEPTEEQTSPQADASASYRSPQEQRLQSPALSFL